MQRLKRSNPHSNDEPPSTAHVDSRSGVVFLHCSWNAYFWIRIFCFAKLTSFEIQEFAGSDFAPTELIPQLLVVVGMNQISHLTV